MADKRIIGLDSFSGNTSSSDYLAIDNATNGTKKIPAPELLKNATLSDIAYSDSQTYPNGSAGKKIKDHDTAIDGLETDIENINTEIAEAKAVTEALNGSIQTLTDSTPYLFRQTPHAGHTEYDEIVGGTVAWNQLCNSQPKDWVANSGTKTVSGDGAKFIATARWGNLAKTFNYVLPNHKLLALVKCKSYTTTNTSFYLRSVVGGTTTTSGVAMPTNMSIVGTVLAVPAESDYLQLLIQDNNASGWGEMEIRDVNLFDLTQMFGSTIADYIYSLETATAGAGVAWFKKLGFNKPYYAYNAGELKSVSGLVSHDMTGFNQWDEEWELGNIDDTTGQNTNSSSRFRSKNYVPVKPNTDYYFYNGSGQTYALRWYEIDKSYLGARAGQTASQVITTPSDCYYLRFVSVQTTYKNDICINISDTAKNGTYEPYQLHSYPLDSDLTLRGIPKLDANNNLYYDGDVYAPSGEVTHYWKVVDMGTLNWGKNGTRFFATLSDMKIYPSEWNKNMVVSNGVRYDSAISGVNPIRDGIGAYNSNQAYIRMAQYDDYTATNFKTAMSRTYLLYPLATPTTETADPYQTPQICDPYGTEEYVSTSIVPVGHNTKYPMSLSDIMPTSNGTYVLKCTVTNGVPTYEWISA